MVFSLREDQQTRLIRRHLRVSQSNRRERLQMWDPQHRDARVVQSKPRPTTTPALLSLELMPGLTITSVLIVDNPGNSVAVLSLLKHATWNGFTPADGVFPAFLCMIGTHTLLAHIDKEGEGQSQLSLLLLSLDALLSDRHWPRPRCALSPSLVDDADLRRSAKGQACAWPAAAFCLQRHGRL